MQIWLQDAGLFIRGLSIILGSTFRVSGFRSRLWIVYVLHKSSLVWKLNIS